MSAVLITGGWGFTGRYIVKALSRRGVKVVNYSRDHVSEEDLEGVVSEQGELFDIPRLLTVIKKHDVDQIVHTAAMSHPTMSLDFPVATFAANVDGTLKLYEAARLSGIRKIINFSSETVYGAVLGPVFEDTPVKPSTPYAVSKVTTELLGDVYTKRYGIDVASLRISQVYGPGNRMPEIVADILRSVVNGLPYRFHEGSDHGLNLIHADDVALATLHALDATGPFPHRIYNISSAEYWTVGEVADLVRRKLPSADISIGPGTLEELDMKGQFDVRTAHDDFGFSAAWGLEAGIAHYIQHLKNNPW